MLNLIKNFERFMVISLLILMSLAVLFSTIELAVILYQQLIHPPFLLLNFAEILEVFGFFFMVLIGLELLETIKAYLENDVIHAEIVFLVAMVAISRKVVILDYNKVSPEVMYGMALIIIALGVSYFLVKKALTDASEKSSNQTGTG